MSSSSQRPLPDSTQKSQQTNIHAPGEIRTHDLSRQAAADLRLIPRGHWDRLFHFIIRNYSITRHYASSVTGRVFNPLSPELNPICYLLALLRAHHFLHVSRIRVKLLTFRLLMSYVYGAPILDVSISHTTTQHSR